MCVLKNVKSSLAYQEIKNLSKKSQKVKNEKHTYLLISIEINEETYADGNFI